VPYYGTEQPLLQLATIAVADASTLVVQPYDPSSLAAIEKAITKDASGFKTSNDGKVVRVTVPMPTEDQRKELVAKARAKTDESRGRIEQARKEGAAAFSSMVTTKQIGPEEEQRLNDELMKLQDRFVKELAEMMGKKEKDLQG